MFYDLDAKVTVDSNDADFYEWGHYIEWDVIEHLRGKKTRIAKEYGSDYVAYTLKDGPLSPEEAMSSLDAGLWQVVISNEMDFLEPNMIWNLVDLPPGCKPKSCKWISKKKLKPDGSIAKCKARHVVKGFRQREDIDFFNACSPHTRIISIRILISLSIVHNLIIHQMDVKTGFLMVK